MRLCAAFLIFMPLMSVGCASHKNSSTSAQAHISKANAAAVTTGEHIDAFKNSVDRVDYKASRARQLLDQGFDK